MFPLIELLMLHTRSPIELAILPPASPEVPFPDLLVTAVLNFTDAPALTRF